MTVEISRSENAIQIFNDGEPLFGGAIALETCRDTWGSWGCPKETPDAYLCRETLERWQIKRVKMLEAGPLRATFFVEFQGKKSNATAQISLLHNSRTVTMNFRVIWNEVGTRLRVVFPKADSLRCGVTGGEVERTLLGDLPVNRYCLWRKGGKAVGVVTDKLCCFGNYENSFAVTVIRGSRYAIEAEHTAEEFIERPACDLGEHTFQLALVPDAAQTVRIAGEMEVRPFVLSADRHPGTLSGCASLLELDNPAVRLIDLVPSPKGMTALLQQFSSPSEIVNIITPAAVQKVEVPFAKLIQVKL